MKHIVLPTVFRRYQRHMRVWFVTTQGIVNVLFVPLCLKVKDSRIFNTTAKLRVDAVQLGLHPSTIQSTIAVRAQDALARLVPTIVLVEQGLRKVGRLFFAGHVCVNCVRFGLHHRIFSLCPKAYIPYFMTNLAKMQNIPRFSPLYLSEYLQFWQSAYKEALALQEKNIPDELFLERETMVNNHLMRHFDKLRNIIDDDYFEWNQVMCVFLCLCQWRVSARKKALRMTDFCKTNNLLQPNAERLSEGILLLKHIDQRWAQWELKDFEEPKKITSIKLSHDNIFEYYKNRQKPSCQKCPDS